KFTLSKFFYYPDYPQQGSGWFAGSGFVDLAAWINPANDPVADQSSPGNSCVAISEALSNVRVGLVSAVPLPSGVNDDTWTRGLWNIDTLLATSIGSFTFDAAYLRLFMSVNPALQPKT